MLGFAAAGLVAHTAFLYYRAVHALHNAAVPLSSERDWYLVAAWGLVVAYLYFAIGHPKAPFGLFLLPLALALIGTATFWANATPLGREPASHIWGAIHGASIGLAAIAILIGFVAGLMYLGQVRHLKHKIVASRGLRLPSLEWLQWTNHRVIVVSALMLGVGVLSGVILNLINVRADSVRLAWNDPVIVSTWLMFLWLLAAALLVAIYRPARQGRQVAYLTVASFVFLVIVLVAGLLSNSRHWGRGERGEGRGERGRNSRVGIENWTLDIGRWPLRSSMADGKSPMTNDKSVGHGAPTPHLSPFAAYHSPLPPRPSPLC